MILWCICSIWYLAPANPALGQMKSSPLWASGWEYSPTRCDTSLASPIIQLIASSIWSWSSSLFKTLNPTKRQFGHDTSLQYHLHRVHDELKLLGIWFLWPSHRTFALHASAGASRAGETQQGWAEWWIAGSGSLAAPLHDFGLQESAIYFSSKPCNDHTRMDGKEEVCIFHLCRSGGWLSSDPFGVGEKKTSPDSTDVQRLMMYLLSKHT